MAYSNKKQVQLLTEALLDYNVKHVVISPGSRNAPLTSHFNHHPDFECYSVVDERCAGFVALGMAMQLQQAVAVCCTSGSATVNYYPAIVEAFYQNIPLVVLTADRPVDLVDQFDGQTIRQNKVFGLHLKMSVQINEGDNHQNTKLLNQSLAYCKANSEPIHINIPFSEPLYEFVHDYKKEFIKNVSNPSINPSINYQQLSEEWNACGKKMILVGMHLPDHELERALKLLSQDDSVVVLTETTSNLKDKKFFNHIDALVFGWEDDAFLQYKPDLLLTIGQNIVSKKIKKLLRKNPPLQHWHLDAFWQPNTYYCLSKSIKINPLTFLSEFCKHTKTQASGYYGSWQQYRAEKEKAQADFLNQANFSDLKVFEFLSATIPEHYTLHFANSSPIRYSQLFDFKQVIYCNRGASGIDGSTSTAIGMAMQKKEPVILVTGDISFFYDSNALWNNYIPNNFKIILINNGGGNIFEIIPGPKQSGALHPFFTTKHPLNAKHLCDMFGFNYLFANNQTSLTEQFNWLLTNHQKPQLLEVDTREIENHKILQAYFKE